MVRPVAKDIAALCEAKVRAELAAADAAAGLQASVPSWSGSVFPAVALLKGEPGPAAQAGGGAITGPDGEAAEKALAALGMGGATWSTLSRPAPGLSTERAATRLRTQLCAVDPAVAVALDAVAASDLAAAYGLGSLGFGTPVAAGGMTLLAVDGLEASLDDEPRKRAVWSQLRGLLQAPAHPESERSARRRPAGGSLF